MDDRRTEICDRLAVDPFLIVVVDETRDEYRAAPADGSIEHETAVIEQPVGAGPNDGISAGAISFQRRTETDL
jgi:hypothetical protein